MFTQISWSTYVTTVALLSVAYYLVIGYLFYKQDFLQLISGKKMGVNNDATAIERYPPLVQSFSDELQAFMNEAKRNQLGKEDILQSLQLLLNKYPRLKDSAFRAPVQNLIINACLSYCSIHLSEEELAVLWN